MKLLIEISTADPDDTVEELWQAMTRDQMADPKSRLTLETRHIVADVRVIKEVSE